MLRFDLSAADLPASWREIRVQGELDLATSGPLAEALESAVSARRNVLLDLCACEFIDSTGIALILHAARRLAGQGRVLRLLAEGLAVTRQLGILGLIDTPLVAATREQALAELPGGGGRRLAA
ncbi:MAG TPA: STAS domain-containing protein [Solirubrobacterales bacterium]